MRNTPHNTSGNFLRASRRASQFKDSFGGIVEPMIVTDENGVILFANKHVVDRTGFSIEEIIGQTPGKLWGNQKDEGFYKDMWKTIKIDKNPFTATMINKRKDGTYYGCELKIEPVLDENENISFFVGIESNFIDAI